MVTTGGRDSSCSGGIRGGGGRIQVGGVLLFLHRLESELAGDQLDLVEVETLVDGDHQAEILEREADDLNGAAS